MVEQHFGPNSSHRTVTPLIYSLIQSFSKSKSITEITGSPCFKYCLSHLTTPSPRDSPVQPVQYPGVICGEKNYNGDGNTWWCYLPASCCYLPVPCPVPGHRSSENLPSPSSLILLYLHPCSKQASHIQLCRENQGHHQSRSLNFPASSLQKLPASLSTPTSLSTILSVPPPFKVICLLCSGCHLLPPSQELSAFVYLFCHLVTGSSSHICKFVQASLTLK